MALPDPEEHHAAGTRTRRRRANNRLGVSTSVGRDFCGRDRASSACELGRLFLRPVPRAVQKRPTPSGPLLAEDQGPSGRSSTATCSGAEARDGAWCVWKGTAATRPLLGWNTLWCAHSPFTARGVGPTFSAGFPAGRAATGSIGPFPRSDVPVRLRVIDLPAEDEVGRGGSGPDPRGSRFAALCVAPVPTNDRFFVATPLHSEESVMPITNEHCWHHGPVSKGYTGWIPGGGIRMGLGSRDSTPVGIPMDRGGTPVD